jgi:predicted dehydrogenase
VRAGDWSAYTGREGLRRTQILEACYQSAQEGREIALVDAASAIPSAAEA